MELLLIFLLLCGLISKNSINLIEAGKINEEKSFDEIFGQRWDDGAEENICQIDQNNQFGQNYQQFDRALVEILEVKEEENEEMFTNCDELGSQFQMPTNNGQFYDNFLNAIDKKKKEIVEKFHRIKEKFKLMGKKYSEKDRAKIKRKIAQKLGTNLEKIYQWKREFGLIKKSYYSYEEKCKILKQFDQIYGKIKIKLNEKLDGKKVKYQKILAKHLGIPINTIYKWKREFKKGKYIKNQKTDDEKREIVEKYFKIKKEFLQMGKHSQKEWDEFYANKQMFGVNFRTIEIWTKKIGTNQNITKEHKAYTTVEKMEMMMQYYQLKKENKNLTDREIAEIFKISTASLSRFKIAFKEKLEKF